MPLCVLLGGTVGPVKAYNSNGLWLREPAQVAAEAIELREEGGFTGLKLRMGRDKLRDDIATVEAVRKSVGERHGADGRFQPGPRHERGSGSAATPSMIMGLAWIEEPIVYDNLDGFAQLAAELKTPDPDRREFLRPARHAHRAAEERRAIW